jgi:hypothetical protein
VDPHFHGDDKKAVIPAKAGIQSIYKEEWIPFYKGMTEENPGSPIRSGMTIYFPDQVGDDKKKMRMIEGVDSASSAE